MTDGPGALNKQQLRAVTATEGFFRVIAGAGSGKTRALAHRFAYLVREVGILPSAILCLTFTNKSAAEMRRRIRALTGDDDTGRIGTFHSFCVTVLQEDIHAVGYPKSFFVLDNSDIDGMLRTVYEERGLTLRDRTFSKARDMIEIRKILRQPDYYEHLISLGAEELRRKYLDAAAADDVIFWGYLYQQKKCFGLDYNDLIKFTLHIFDISDAIRLKWQGRLEYIMVDEFQDIDDLQYRLLRVLCGCHGNLFVVGDPDQTIFTWRGANVRFLLDFDKTFPGAETLLMTHNYRSTPQILAAADSLISRNVNRLEKSLVPTLPAGPPAVYHHAPTAQAEAEWIAREIARLAAEGAGFGDMAVLYRAHYISRVLEDVFSKEGLAYTISSGVPFYSRAEIKDALSYLRLVVYGDDLSFLRVANVPKRNLGERRIQFLQDYAAQKSCSLLTALGRTADEDIFKNTKSRRLLALVERFRAVRDELPASELLRGLLDESGYEAMLRTQGSQERLDNLAELLQSVHEFEATCGEESLPEHYLARAALMGGADAIPAKNAVRLMTVHTAKGLEFPYVFLCGLSEGIFPSKKTATREAMEEERRLAFVAFTRARRGLFLSDAEGRGLDGAYRYPSRFIFDVDRRLLSYTAELDDRLVSEARRVAADSEATLALLSAAPRFDRGDRIVHGIMGAGEILEFDRDKNAYLIQFDSLPTPRKISLKATLTREEGP